MTLYNRLAKPEKPAQILPTLTERLNFSKTTSIGMWMKTKQKILSK
jgi:hypothetical protein